MKEKKWIKQMVKKLKKFYNKRTLRRQVKIYHKSDGQ